MSRRPIKGPPDGSLGPTGAAIIVVGAWILSAKNFIIAAVIILVILAILANIFGDD